MADPGEERRWERGWDGHSRAQQERLARLPLWEKLAWLEEAQRLARQLARNSDRDPGSPAAGGPAPKTGG